LIDFVFATFAVRVSRVALYKFMKKYGLDQIPGPATPDSPPLTAPSPQPQEQPPAPASPSVLVAVPLAAPPFSSRARSTLAPSC
jgi:hypothetical protein